MSNILLIALLLISLTLAFICFSVAFNGLKNTMKLITFGVFIGLVGGGVISAVVS